MYNDPQLNDLASKVELSNQNVIVAMAQYREAVDQVQIARAALFPTVTATPSVVVTRGSTLSSRGQLISGSSSGTSSGGSTSSRGSGVNVNYAMPFDISYQADIWGNIRRSVTASKDTAQASAADLENAKLTFQAQLAQMYFQLHGLDADADLLRRNVDNFRTVIAADPGAIRRRRLIWRRCRASENAAGDHARAAHRRRRRPRAIRARDRGAHWRNARDGFDPGKDCERAATGDSSRVCRRR